MEAVRDFQQKKTTFDALLAASKALSSRSWHYDATTPGADLPLGCLVHYTVHRATELVGRGFATVVTRESRFGGSWITAAVSIAVGGGRTVALLAGSVEGCVMAGKYTHSGDGLTATFKAAPEVERHRSDFIDQLGLAGYKLVTDDTHQVKDSYPLSFSQCGVLPGAKVPALVHVKVGGGAPQPTVVKAINKDNAYFQVLFEVDGDAFQMRLRRVRDKKGDLFVIVYGEFQISGSDKTVCLAEAPPVLLQTAELERADALAAKVHNKDMLVRFCARPLAWLSTLNKTLGATRWTLTKVAAVWEWSDLHEMRVLPPGGEMTVTAKRQNEQLKVGGNDSEFRIGVGNRLSISKAQLRKFGVYGTYELGDVIVTVSGPDTTNAAKLWDVRTDAPIGKGGKKRASAPTSAPAPIKQRGPLDAYFKK